MTTYGYVRVSTDYQDYQSQRSAIENRFKIDEWVEDTGTGRVTQPNLLRLIKKATNKDEIIVYAFDRLGRNTNQVLSIVAGFKVKGTALISVREGIDINSPSGNMVFQVMCSIAEFESSVIADRVRQGMEAAVKRGVRLGAPKILDDPKNVEAIKYAKDLRSEGKPYRYIKQALWKERRVKISLGSLVRFLKEDCVN